MDKASFLIALLLLQCVFKSQQRTDVSRASTGDEMGATDCPRETAIIRSDNTQSFDCFTSMKAEGCDLQFVNNPDSVGFVEVNDTKELEINVPANPHQGATEECKNHSLGRIEVLVDTHNTNQSVWDANIGEYAVKNTTTFRLLGLQPQLHAFIGFKEHWGGLLIKLFLTCLDKNDTNMKDGADKRCVFIKFGGKLTYPLSGDKYFPYVPSTTTTSTVSLTKMASTRDTSITTTTGSSVSQTKTTSTNKTSTKETTPQTSKAQPSSVQPKTTTTATPKQNNTAASAPLMGGGGNDLVMIFSIVAAIIILLIIIVLIIVLCLCKKKRNRDEKSSFTKEKTVTEHHYYHNGVTNKTYQTDDENINTLFNMDVNTENEFYKLDELPDGQPDKEEDTVCSSAFIYMGPTSDHPEKQNENESALSDDIHQDEPISNGFAPVELVIPAEAIHNEYNLI